MGCRRLSVGRRCPGPGAGSRGTGTAFYASVAAGTHDPETRALAEEFTEEETGHVRALKELILRYATV